MQLLFWLSFAAIAYSYFGYPLVLAMWGRIRPQRLNPMSEELPQITIVLPVHNEESKLTAKLDNTLELDYPADLVGIVIVSDGSTDRSVAIANGYADNDPRIQVIELDERGGKGKALNAGIEAAEGPVVVFTDVGITLEIGSLRAIVGPFGDPAIGCVSGEDEIPEVGGEGLYGRYELFLRRQESKIHSIVGASGSFYAQRRELCPQFPPHIAPDFLSVLHTVDRGYRAVSESRARGRMTATRSAGAEFRRKVRTLVRGLAGLESHLHLLNPLRFGKFAFLLFSHKVMRWLVPAFLVMMLGAHLLLLSEPLYAVLAVPHIAFYLLGVALLLEAPFVPSILPIRIAAYFINVNAAITVAWWQYFSGVRSSVWAPTRR